MRHQELRDPLEVDTWGVLKPASGLPSDPPPPRRDVTRGHGRAQVLAAQQARAEPAPERAEPVSLCPRSGLQQAEEALEMVTRWENVNANAVLSLSLKYTTI